VTPVSPLGLRSSNLTSARDAGLELERFDFVARGQDEALLRLVGRWAPGRTPAVDVPRLLIDAGHGPRWSLPRPGSGGWVFGALPDGEPWELGFSAGLELVRGAETLFALDLVHSLLVELPRPVERLEARARVPRGVSRLVRPYSLRRAGMLLLAVSPLALAPVAALADGDQSTQTTDGVVVSADCPSTGVLPDGTKCTLPDANGNGGGTGLTTTGDPSTPTDGNSSGTGSNDAAPPTDGGASSPADPSPAQAGDAGQAAAPSNAPGDAAATPASSTGDGSATTADGAQATPIAGTRAVRHAGRPATHHAPARGHGRSHRHARHERKHHSGQASAPQVPVNAPALDPSFFVDRSAVPVELIPIYKAAEKRYDVPWQVLAAVNAIETDYGRNLAVSSAGAVGWMQFMPSSWYRFGVDADRDGLADPMDARDAIFAAARYLHFFGATHNLRGALFAYNHADWYVDAVLLQAESMGDLPKDLARLAREAQPRLHRLMHMRTTSLEQRVLNDPRISIYECGREDIATHQIDRRVLVTLEYLAASGLKPTVTALKCGHSLYTSSGNISEHSTGDAVDIAAINDIPILDHQGPGTITDTTIRRLLTLQGSLRPHQIISLMTFAGADNTLSLPDHADHIHVGFRPTGAPTPAPGAPDAGTVGNETEPLTGVVDALKPSAPSPWAFAVPRG